jgi:hypothetical protein
MVMRILGFGGVDLLYKDSEVATNQWDPYGIYEFEDVSEELYRSHDKTWTANKAIKLVSLYVVQWMPLDRPTKVIFTLRDQTEIITSLLAKRLIIDTDIAQSVLDARRFLEYHNIPTLYLNHRDIIKYPKTSALQIADFLDAPLDIDQMIKGMDRSARTRKSNDLGPLISMRAEDYTSGPMEIRVAFTDEEGVRTVEQNGGNENVSRHSASS